MGLRDIGATLPPGFRFYPSDEELVCHYLSKKVANAQVAKDTLVEIDLHTCEPWQLPDVAKLNANEWYFFSFRDRKYATGFRTNRATTTGYWKATGKDRTVVDPSTRRIVGMRKTLVFYKNRAPNGIKTGWIMHEFRLENPHLPPKEDWVLCRVFHKAKSDNGGESDVSDSIRGGEGCATSPPPLIEDSGLMTPTTAASTRGPYNVQLISCPAAGHHQQQQQHYWNSCFPTMLAQLDRNYLQLSREITYGGSPSNDDNHNHHNISGGGGGGSTGFFFDSMMSFGESGDQVRASSLADMQFDDDDSSLIFI